MESGMVPSNLNDNLNAIIEISRNNAISTSNLIQKVGEQEQRISEVMVAVDGLTERMDLREQNEVISPSQKRTVNRAVRRRVYKMLGLRTKSGRLAPESKLVRNVYGSLFFSRLYSSLADRFDVSAYDEVRAVDYDECMAHVKTWEPECGIDMLKSEAEDNWTANHPGMSVREYLGTLL